MWYGHIKTIAFEYDQIIVRQIIIVICLYFIVCAKEINKFLINNLIHSWTGYPIWPDVSKCERSSKTGLRRSRSNLDICNQMYVSDFFTFYLKYKSTAANYLLKNFFFLTAFVPCVASFASLSRTLSSRSSCLRSRSIAALRSFNFFLRRSRSLLALMPIV